LSFLYASGGVDIGDIAVGGNLLVVEKQSE
jgi:hypothetical protein